VSTIAAASRTVDGRSRARLRATPDVWFGLLGAALIACALAFAAFGTPPIPPGPMVALGVPSPLTGMTRSFVALAGGHVTHAFALHPLGPLCFAACLVAVVNAVVERRNGRRAAIVRRALGVPYAPWLLAIAFIAVWIRQIVVFS
jgi:hypothetical protein